MTTTPSSSAAAAATSNPAVASAAARPPTPRTIETDEPAAPRWRWRGATAVVLTMLVVAAAAGVFFLTRVGASRAVTPAEEAATAPSAGQPGMVALPAGAAAKNLIDVVPVRRTRLAGEIHMIGNVSYSADHVAMVGPLVSGRVARLAAGIGNHVERGQIIAEIESVDVGEARAALIAATARLSAAEANLHRERELADKQISSVREREVAEAQWVGERAAMRAAQQRLRAIGLSAAEIQAVEVRDDGGRVPMRAPIAGTVIERLVTLGQAVERATDAFKIADLAQVWVLLDLYEKDLARVHVGQAVELRTDTLPGEVFPGRVAYVLPVIDEATRAAKVRIEIANPSGKLRIGQLVTAKLIGDAGSETTPVLAIPVAAVQRIDGKPVVFVQRGAAFQRRIVELGVSGGELVEVRTGLADGDAVAAKGAFLLKSELLR
jgi:cobalt-zinc-cadmium efflux system membrane fusion protein